MDLFDELVYYLDDDYDYDSEEPEYHKCRVCGKKIIIDEDGENVDNPICNFYSFNGCQVKLREIDMLLKSMHKSIILRHSICYIKNYKIGYHVN